MGNTLFRPWTNSGDFFGLKLKRRSAGRRSAASTRQSHRSSSPYLLEQLEPRTLLSHSAPAPLSAIHSSASPAAIVAADASASIFGIVWNYTLQQGTGTPTTGTIDFSQLSDGTVSATFGAPVGEGNLVLLGTFDGGSLSVQFNTNTGEDGTQYYDILQGALSADGNTINGTFTNQWQDETGPITITRPGGLSIGKPPSNTEAGEKMSPVTVAVLGTDGNIDKSADTTITATITSTGSGSGTLSGDTSEDIAAGVATFSELSITAPGQYTMTFTDSEGDTTTSSAFQISGGTLRFKQPVKSGVAGSAIEPAVQVELVNSKNKPITNASSLVTLSISGSNSSNPITGNSAELVNGIAVFSSLKLGVPGDYTLNATDAQGDTSVLSNSFEVTGVHLAIRKQPAKAGVNAPLSYLVELEDARNRLVNSSSVGLGLALDTSEGDPSAVLSDSSDIFNFGKADNTGSPPVAINKPGTYKITFTVINEGGDSFNYPIDPITSAPFDILANHLAFLPGKSPSTVVVNAPLHYAVALENYKHQVVTTNSSDQLLFTLNTIPPGGTGVLAAGMDSLVAGVADNSGNVPLSIDTPGTYTLTVVDVPANPGDPVPTSIISGHFKVILPRSK